MWGFIVAYGKAGDVLVETASVISQVRTSWHKKLIFSKPQLTKLNEDSKIGLIIGDL